MDLVQLIEQRKVKVAELEGVLVKVKAEKRKLDTDEGEQFEKLNAEIKSIDVQIEQKNKNNNIITIKNTNKQMEKFSLLRAIRNTAEGRSQDAVTLAILDEGKKGFANAGLSFRGSLTIPYKFEERAPIINATTAGEGEYAVGIQQFDMLGALRGNLCAIKAGATLLSGLVGDVSIPLYGGSSALWKAENAIAVSGQSSFTEVTMSPKRLTFFIDISKQFLVQDSTQAEALLMRDLSDAIQAKLEQTIFDNVVAGDGPAGLFYGASFTSVGAVSYAKIVALETAIAANNALTQNLAYITRPQLVGAMKTTIKSGSTASFIMDGNTGANGYPVLASTNVTDLGATGQTGTGYSGIIFANWADLLIGNWGGLDITVDPYTQAAYGAVRLVVNTYWDLKRRRDASFAYGALA
jgi:HK97 family phage major capsid protein